MGDVSDKSRRPHSWCLTGSSLSAMGASCYKSKKEDDKAPEYASTPPSHPLFRVLTNDAAHQPSLSDGKAADYYKWNPQPIAGSHDTYLGQDIKSGKPVLVTNFELKSGFTEAQKGTLYAMLKYKPVVSDTTGAVCCVQVDRALYSGSTLSLVSEFKGGLTVGEAIAAAGDKYDEAHALTWIAEIAQGIQDLHKKGFVQGHLDIGALRVHKLSETSDGLQIPYFSLHKLGAPTQEQPWAGATPPEILLGEAKEFNEATDIWNLGVILHIMLVAEPPLNADAQESKNIILQRRKENEGKVNMAHIAGWHKMQQDTKDLVQDLLQLDPQKRLTAEQLCNELEHLLRKQFPGQGEHLDVKIE